MAEGQAGQAKKKPALSSRIMQMKFMQRGKDKPVAPAAAAAEQVQEAEESKWVTDGAAAPSGCVVLMEGNPPPGAHMGHMSFHSFNPELQKIQEEHANLLNNAKKNSMSAAEAKPVSDMEMADQMQQIRSNVNDDEAPKSMRSNRSKSHRTEATKSASSGHKRKRHKGATS